MSAMLCMGERGQGFDATVPSVGCGGDLRSALPSMGERGQGFDVFKLLIAAVVAGAILLILMQTLQILPNLNTQDPNEVASGTIKSAINQLGVPKYIENVTFKKDASLRASTIAQNSKALSENQVCVRVSASAPNGSNFKENSDKSVIGYTGSSDQQVRLVILCDRQDNLESSIDDYAELGLGDLEVTSSTISGCFDGVPPSSRACLVAIVSEQ